MKRVLAVLMAVVMVCGVTILPESVVKASDVAQYQVGDTVDGSLLTDEEFSEVTVGSMTRGIYLKSGTSSISKYGTGKITAVGTTVAQKKVSVVSVTVRVERLIGTSWVVFTSWSATKYNAYSVGTEKTMSVPQGYFYRTHSFHSANSDASSSVTDGLYI